MISNESNSDLYGISRIDDDQHHSHAWRVSLRRHGQRHVKNFTDKKCGGADAALRCAQRYRDEFLSSHPPISRKEVCLVRRSNNQSGVTGVCTYAKRHERRDGSIKENWYWEASWPGADGKPVKKVFSVNNFGDSMARQMAINARAEAIHALEGVFWASERGLVDEVAVAEQGHSSAPRQVA